MTNATDPISAITSDHDGSPATIEFEGLTKREHFAAMAMQGMLANSDTVASLYGDAFANEAVDRAERLIKALNIPMCPDCKLSNADGHYDADESHCPIYEQAWSEQK